MQPADDTEIHDAASTFDARLEDVRAAPADEGIVELIVKGENGSTDRRYVLSASNGRVEISESASEAPDAGA